MSRTRARNGVLIFVAPSRRKLAVLGDVGVQAKVAPNLWVRVVDRMTTDFRRGNRTAGLIAAVALLADALAAVFPAGAHDVDGCRFGVVRKNLIVAARAISASPQQPACSRPAVPFPCIAGVLSLRRLINTGGTR